ncbi:hypothetical protein BIW11_05114 [Tropilaelaps mercedesae]|uniref:Uncharacterized protein n=1 Tax=Tropilaelaps mercedesae TaxID=418985 RepID=A0A1V9Y3S1_9ACAR|nr:hypothetical protein BIW11_05114 [Tropilaelaps mercedesae]
MSFSFLDNLDVDEVDPEHTFIREVPETPINQQFGLPEGAENKQGKGDTFSSFHKSPRSKKPLDKPLSEDTLHAEKSTPSPALRRSKRIAKKKDADAGDAGRKTKTIKNNRKTRASRKAGKSELPKKEDSSLYMTTSPKSEACISTDDKKTEYPIAHLAPLKKLQSTPGPSHNRSLLKVAVGNAALKPSTPLSRRQSSCNGETQKHGPQRNSSLTRKSEQRPVPDKLIVRKVTKVPVKSKMDRQNKKSKDANVTFKGTEPKVSVKDPIQEAESEKRTITSTGATDRLLAKDPVKEIGAKKRNITISGPVKVSLTKNHVTHIQPTAAKLVKQRSTITLSSNHQARVPMKIVDSNHNDVKIKSTDPTQAVKRVMLMPKIDLKPPGAKPVKFTTERNSTSKKFPDKNRDARKSLKSIVKKSTVGLNETRAKARVTMAVEEMVEKSPTKYGSAAAPRKSCKMADLYKHVQSKVAQLIHGTTISSAPNIRNTKNPAVKTDAGVRAAKGPLHHKPSLEPRKVRPRSISQAATSIGVATAAIAKNSFGQTSPRKSRTSDHLQPLRTKKAAILSNLPAGKPSKLDVMKTCYRRTTRKQA